MKCQICDVEREEDRVRNLTLRYCNLKVSIPICLRCIGGNLNEMSQEIKEKALVVFAREGRFQ